MDYHAFDKLSYGLYIVSSEAGGKAAGCIVNTLGQVTVSPVQVAVTINKENQTTRTILESGKFSATVLAESASMELIGRFGFQCSRDVDKFAGFAWARDINGVPYVTEQCAARFACTVVNEVDLGTHILFVARVDDWAVLDDVPQMTYDYYHAVKKGLTPPKASSYRPPEEKVTGWRCTVCGYIYEGEALPANYKCPICGQGAEVFEKSPVEFSRENQCKTARRALPLPEAPAVFCTRMARKGPVREVTFLFWPNCAAKRPSGCTASPAAPRWKALRHRPRTARRCPTND